MPKDQLKEKLAPMMEYVRFPLITGKDLAEEIVPLGLVADHLLLEALTSKFSERAGRVFPFQNPQWISQSHDPD